MTIQHAPKKAVLPGQSSTAMIGYTQMLAWYAIHSTLQLNHSKSFKHVNPISQALNTWSLRGTQSLQNSLCYHRYR